MVDSGWVLLEPVGSVGNRLAAIASARLLAHDLNRELVLDWRLTPECCCPWEQLVESAYRVRVLRGGGRVPRPDPEPKSFSFNCGSLGALVSSEATPQKPENDEEEEPALCAGAELLRLWGLLRRSAKHEDLLKQGLERLNSRHLALFREGLAHLIDVSSARWRGLKRFKDTGTLFKVFGSDQVACLCIRAFDFFYPPGPKEREHANTVKELGQSLRTIAFAQGVRERVVEAVPGSVGIYVPQAVSNIGRHAFSPVHWLEMELAVFSLRTLLLVTDDPRVEEHFTRLYSIRLKTVFKKQRRNRSQPEHVQDSLAQLLTLAKCDRLFGTQGCIDLRLAAVLTGRSIQVDTVFYEEEDTQDEVEVTLANPVHPRGPFFLAGSWNDWKDFTQLMPSNNASEFAYSASISVRQAPGVEEFQVVQNKDWEQRFYPSSNGAEILGPSSAHGSNWRVKVPTGSAGLRILWDPRGARSFTWRFVGRSGFEWDPEGDGDSRLSRSSPYAVAGTWDAWKTFKDLEPSNTGEATFFCKIRVRKAPGEEEFQIFKDRDWKLRFYPTGQSLGSEVQGPDSTHGANWQVVVPNDCRYLMLHWDPRGDKSVDWQFLDKDNEVLPSPGNRSGPFYLVGSWDGWDKMFAMLPIANSHKVCVATVPVEPDHSELGFEEFVIVQDRDWDQTFYPTFLSARKVLGPDDKCKKGQYWRVRIRPQYRFLRVTFAPFDRTLDWHFIGRDGEAIATERLRRAAPTAIGNWFVLAELGRGWAGGVVYKAEYQLSDEGRPGAAAAAAEAFSVATLCRLITRTPYSSGAVRAALRATDNGFLRLANERGPVTLRPAVVASPCSALLRAVCLAGLPETSELAALVLVHPSLCDLGLAQWQEEAVASRAAISVFGRAHERRSAPPPDDRSRPPKELLAEPADAAGSDDASEPRGHLDFLLDVMEEHAVAREEEKRRAGEGPSEIRPELQWQLYVTMHHGCFSTGSIAALAACCRAAALASACSSQGLPAQAAASSQQPPLALQAAWPQPRPIVGTMAAVKSPLPLQEIRMLKRLQGVEGVPEILEVGLDHENLFFCAMPLLGPSLDELLTRCNHDGLGGRVSWPVARGLGARMVQVLRDVHRRGVVHCDMKPANVLVGLQDASVYIIDCGLSGLIGASYFKAAAGTMPYNSVRAGFPGVRTPADDLESVGWILLRCVLGQLPWEKRSPGITRDEPDAWRRRSEGMSLMKQWFLEDRSIFGEETDHCPGELLDFLRGTQQLGPLGTADASHLAPWVSSISSERWSRFVEATDPSERGCERSWKTRTLHMAPQGIVTWRSSPTDVSSQCIFDVPEGLKVRTTGVSCHDSEGFEWLEVDPVWMPRNPLPFVDDSWLLVASEKGKQLVPTSYNSGGPRKMRT